jgi:hypothetical protein
MELTLYHTSISCHIIIEIHRCFLHAFNLPYFYRKCKNYLQLFFSPLNSAGEYIFTMNMLFYTNCTGYGISKIFNHYYPNIATEYIYVRKAVLETET